MKKQTREQWLDWRRGGLGGSDVAAILGLSRFAGPWDVYLSKIHGVDGDENKTTKRGKVLERAVGQWAADELELELADSEPLESKAEPWIRGTPDFVLLNEIGLAIEGLECKTVRYLDPDEWGEPGTNQIPISHRIQDAWYMRIADLPRWNHAVFSTTQERFELYVVDRDLEIEQRLVDKARQWWQRHIVGKEPPAIDGSASAGRYLRERHREPDEIMLESTVEIDELAQQIRQLQDVKKAAQQHLAKAQNELKARIGDAKGVRGTFGSFKWSRYEQSKLDQKALRKARPDLAAVLDEYTTTSPASRLFPNWK